ncbi:hypothetical protein TSH100_00600 [Azospirillum sp. TSH100]|nr:hypothetical protein TSH100_00600 [Azospirillum sp. TSH100]
MNPTPVRCPSGRRWKPTRTPRPLSPPSLRRRPCSSRPPLPRLPRARSPTLPPLSTGRPKRRRRKHATNRRGPARQRTGRSSRPWANGSAAVSAMRTPSRQRLCARRRRGTTALPRSSSPASSATAVPSR